MAKTIKLPDSWGNSIYDVARKAKVTAENKQELVEFDFNDIQCLVSATTDTDLLIRDYMNAHLMEWKTVGPDCAGQYPKEIQAELDSRTQAREKRQEESRIEMERKDSEDKLAFEKSVVGIELEIIDAEGYAKYKQLNNDGGYGFCIFEYLEGWAKLMQAEIANGIPLKDCASKTSHQLGFLGITGFMYGAAVSTLAKYWKHGEELRKWHNKEYHHEGEGVVNPAILTIK